MAAEVFSVSHTFASAGSQTGSGSSWTTPGYITANDGQVARNFTSSTSKTLLATFPFSAVPDRASLQGIEVIAERWCASASECSDNTFQLYDPSKGTLQGNNLAAAGFWPNLSWHTQTYGGPNNDWGVAIEGYMPSDLQLAIVLNGSSGGAKYYDYITMAYWYSLPACVDATHVNKHKNLWAVEIPWRSNADGEVDWDIELLGTLDRLVTIPSSSQSPTANYDVKLYNQNDVDLMFGRGDNRSASSEEAEMLYSSSPTTGKAFETKVNGTYRFHVENAGADNGGVAVLFYWR